MKIAVIGAGFSGMLAAYLLKKENIQVTIYEKQETLGGHCKTLISENMYIDLGTTFSFKGKIKELFMALKVPYSEKFTYRNFLDQDYKSVQHIDPKLIEQLIKEYALFKQVLTKYKDYLNTTNYHEIHVDLLQPLSDFLKANNLHTMCHLVAPHLSSFGYGDICKTQAYYALRIFNSEAIDAFIKGEKFLFLDHGLSDLIKGLSHNIKDIRYNIEVKHIEACGKQVLVESDYGRDYYDKVLITTKLPQNVIKDDLYNQLMKQIDTNPFVTCAYEVSHSNLATTYYKANLGRINKIQFFHPIKCEDRTVIVTYAYGKISQAFMRDISNDLEMAGIQIKHLITAKQWFIFPHLKEEQLTTNFYKEIAERQSQTNIHLIGSLICEPSLSKLYQSVKTTVAEILNHKNM